MIKQQYYAILIFLSLALATGSASAQVTVGENKEPAPFSSLQLEGNGGLRLPQLSTINRNMINSSSSLANGLWIYNSSLYNTNYWDGSGWKSIQDATIIRNGLLYSSNMTIGLGGHLFRHTNINTTTGNNLKFLTGDKTFSINTSLFRVTNDEVTIQPNKLTVGTSNPLTITTRGNLNDINTGSQLKITSDVDQANTITVNGNQATITGNFAYKSGNEADDKVLISDADGKGYWANLRPNTQYKEGVLKTTQDITPNSDQNSIVFKDITQTSLVLKPGKWLIFAKYVTKCERNVASNDNNRRYVWTTLKARPTGSVAYNDITTAGATTSMGSNRRSFPQLTYLVDINVETEFVVYCGTQNRYVSLDSSLGGFKFYAISIILPGE